MTQLHFTPEDFATFVLIFLMDKVINPEKLVVKNERFNEFIEKNSSRLKPILMKYYLDSDAVERVNYKRLKDVLEVSKDEKKNKEKSHTIKITSEKSKKEREEEKGFLKRLIAKIIGNESLDVEDKNLILEYLKEEEN